MRPRQRHLAIAVGSLSAMAFEILAGFAMFSESGATGNLRLWIVLGTTGAVATTGAAALLLFRLSVRQGRMEADQLVKEGMERANRLAEVGRLAAGVAHEIHNPLQGVFGYLALLDRENVEPEKRRAHVLAIRGALQKIERLTRDLLDYANPKPARRVAVSTYDLFINVTRHLEADPRFVHIQFLRDVAAGTPSVHADPAAIERVLLNLLLNAADAMEGRGVIQLLSRRGPDGFVEMEVADDGPGVSKEQIPYLFEAFRSGRGSTGLGLWICSNLIGSLGGTITLAPPVPAGQGGRALETPRGARFLIQLPAAP